MLAIKKGLLVREILEVAGVLKSMLIEIAYLA